MLSYISYPAKARGASGSAPAPPTGGGGAAGAAGERSSAANRAGAKLPAPEPVPEPPLPSAPPNPARPTPPGASDSAHSGSSGSWPCSQSGPESETRAPTMARCGSCGGRAPDQGREPRGWPLQPGSTAPARSRLSRLRRDRVSIWGQGRWKSPPPHGGIHSPFGCREGRGARSRHERSLATYSQR